MARGRKAGGKKNDHCNNNPTNKRRSRIDRKSSTTTQANYNEYERSKSKSSNRNNVIKIKSK